MNIFSKIIDIDNIREAYFEVVQKFEEQNRSYSYSGIDGKRLADYDFDSENLFLTIKKELEVFQTINPSLEIMIPKKNKPGLRPVYIHTLKERIKSQAVFRIVYPYFDEYFTHYVYSYRPSHPYETAIKTVVRRYKNTAHQESILIGDIGSYSDNINPQILKKQIQRIGFDADTNKILYLYVDMQMFQEGEIRSSERGILTGLPITVLFNNLYLNSFDKIFGKELSLYRRVGDDFIAFDNKENLQKAKKEMHVLLDELLVPQKDQKIEIIKKNNCFKFLGYEFNNGIISILPKSVRNIKIYLRSRLRYRPFHSCDKKIKNFKKLFFEKEALKYYFVQIVRQYNHCNDREQIKHLADYFLIRATIYFFGTYTKRNRRLTQKILRDLDIPSLTQYYRAFHSGSMSPEKLHTLTT
ncbi:MAG: reverse transcriptase domain-containing protein [Candidatus Pacebacteria bacterium]|nr:reverse transcriptase domain-containing protein [Candidatus Paceibacterota bacterium]